VVCPEISTHHFEYFKFPRIELLAAQTIFVNLKHVNQIVFVILLIFLTTPLSKAEEICRCKFERISASEELDARQWLENRGRSGNSASGLNGDSFMRVLVHYVREGLFLTNPSQRVTKELFFTPKLLSGHCILAQGISSIYLEELGIGIESQILLEMGNDFGSSQVHAFVIVQMPDGAFYLIDPTFAQFFNDESGAGKIGQKLLDSGSPALGKELCEKGYSRIDNQQLQNYLNSFPVDQSETKNMTLEKLLLRPRNKRTINRLLYGDSLPVLKSLEQLRFKVLHQAIDQ